MTKTLDKAVREAWAKEIRSDFIDHLRDISRQYTNIVNEGWLSAAGTDFAYYVGVDDDDNVMAEVYESEWAFENENPPIASFKFKLRVVPA